MVLNFNFSAESYKSVDKNDLISLFREKSANEIKDVIDSNLGEELERSEVKFWPFWTRKAPRDKNKINLELMFEHMVEI